MIEIENNLRALLRDTLHLGDRADALTADSPLLGALPELDSMAVAHLLSALEERFDFLIDDDEVSAELFESFGSLAAFVAAKRSRA